MMELLGFSALPQPEGTVHESPVGPSLERGKDEQIHRLT